MAIKLKLNSKEILEMKFPNVPRGYDPLYVDEYLDKVIRDYKQWKQTILWKQMILTL